MSQWLAPPPRASASRSHFPVASRRFCKHFPLGRTGWASPSRGIADSRGDRHDTENRLSPCRRSPALPPVTAATRLRARARLPHSHDVNGGEHLRPTRRPRPSREATQRRPRPKGVDSHDKSRAFRSTPARVSANASRRPPRSHAAHRQSVPVVGITGLFDPSRAHGHSAAAKRRPAVPTRYKTRPVHIPRRRPRQGPGGQTRGKPAPIPPPSPRASRDRACDP